MEASVKDKIDRAAEVLQKAGASEVYVFGSVAEDRAGPDSDIDLAVRGLPHEAFFEAVGRIAMSVTERFDLVDIDDPNPFTEMLLRKGRLVRVA